MARAQQSVGAVTVWMIIFAALWLTSTVFLIILYTGQEELVADANRWEQAKNRCISGSEENSITIIQNASDGGPTQVGILEQTRGDTALLASGNETDDAATIRTKRDKLFEEVESAGVLPDGTSLADNSLLEGARALFVALQSDNRQVVELSNEIARLTDEVNRLEELTTGQQSTFVEKTKEIEAKLAKIEVDRDQYRKDRDDAMAKLETDFEEQNNQSTLEITRERELNKKLQTDNEALRGRITAQAQKSDGLVGGPVALATARQADGEIVLAVPGDDIVYINRGSRDRLTLGLQFAVYQGDQSIPSDGRAKARIEVVGINDSTAECKIVNTRSGLAIFEGDIIANPIYNPNRTQNFLVIGDFDLNYDGRADGDGARLVEALVREWGGAVTDDLDATTDFVVLGAAPRRPRVVEGRSLTPEQAERQAQRLTRWKDYSDTVASATALSVPILSQDLFLNFLGYRGQ
ncbi:MAG: hypothetical protein ACYTHJ_15905 [Planctomycetota bacterium]|jgi:hypothetical protein